MAEAADLYQRLVVPGNDARDRWLAGGPTTAQNLAEHERRAQQAADAFQTFATQLQAHDWPEQVSALIGQLVADLDLRVQAFRLVAHQPTVLGYAGAARRVPLSSDAAGQILRHSAVVRVVKGRADTYAAR